MRLVTSLLVRRPFLTVPKRSRNLMAICLLKEDIDANRFVITFDD
jgi:hypothetical protein